MSLQGGKLHHLLIKLIELGSRFNWFLDLNQTSILENSLSCSSYDGCRDELIVIDWKAAGVLLEPRL